MLFPSSAFKSSKGSTLLLLSPSCSGLLGWGLLQRAYNLSLFNILRSLAPLASFSLFISDVTRGCTRKGRSWWSGTTGTAGEAPSTWAVSNASKSGFFSSSTIPSRMLAFSWLVPIWVRSKRHWEGPWRSSGSSCL